MNVVQREKHRYLKSQTKQKNQLVRKDYSAGIRGATTFTANHVVRPPNKTPRYQFEHENITTTTNSKKSSMGPPLEPLRSLKRKIISNSTSSKPESSSSDKVRPRILASDSAVETSSRDFCTPRNKPSALRYISSSSKGGHSTRSARSTSSSAIQASVILAISEGRGMARGEIGIAAVDLRHPHLVLCQFSDNLLYTHTLTKINYFNPVEIILPHTFCDGSQPNQLYKLIKDQYPLITLSPVQRRHFSAVAGRQHIQSLCAPQYSAVYLQVLEKFYALTAAAAVLKYVEYIQCVVFSRESLKIEYHSSENTMIIDVNTATQLELVQPLVPSAGSTCCLLGVLGPTYTIGGIRSLRASILQPSCKKEFIEARLDAVQDLIENEQGLMTALKDVIKNLADVDKILLLCFEATNLNVDKMCEAQLNQTLLLKTTMDMVPKFIEALSAAESGRLRKIKMDFENPHYTKIEECISEIIQGDAHLEKGAMGSLQRCFAVKPDINGLLDVARRTYSELIEDIQKIVEQLSEAYDLPLRLNQNVLRGFHIVHPVAPKNRRNFNIEDLPPIFIQVQNSGASVTMTTEELVVLDQQAKESLSEIQKMSNIVISGLLKDLRPYMPSLYKLCENVAELDILLSLAQASSIGSYIRPQFNDYLEIKNSVHPLLDYNSQVMPVQNDINASPEYNFTIITGPNMGGKTIYIKQVALMQIMAQIGCYVPATNAVLRLCDRLFSRIGFNDSVELNASTYVIEMKEVQHILKGLTATSLVIIDELCRGTSTNEGTSLAWAICEELILSDAFTFFTTHFIYLTRLQDLYFSVINLNTKVIEEEVVGSSTSEKRLIYEHKIEPGTTKIEHYGLALAAKTNMPEATVNLAKELAELISKNIKPGEIRTPEISDRKILFELNAKLRKEARKNGNSNESFQEIMSRFIDGHPELVERIKASRNNNTNNRESDVEPLAAPSFREESSKSFSNSDIKNKECDSPKSSRRNEEKRQHNTYSTSNDRHEDIYNEIKNVEINEISNNKIYTAVKSSNELLNTVLNINDEEPIIMNSPEDLKSNSLDKHNSLRDFNTTDYSRHHFAKNINEIGVEKSSSGIKQKYSLLHSGNDFKRNQEDNPINDDDYQISDEISNTSSDVADTLTQVIECSVESETLTLEKSISLMSIDEELMNETIKEINEDLTSGWSNNLDTLILTPPLDFRDY